MFDRKKRKFFAIIALVLILIIACTMANASTPSDTSSHWAKDKIQKWIDKDLASGFADGTFKPDKSISRAEFMAFTNNAFGYTESDKINYKDVPTGVWYEGVVAKAAAAGYIAGYPDGTMKPDEPITRQEVAAIISRIQNLSGNPSAALKYNDGGKIPEWAKGAVGAVIEVGYMNGYPDGSFKPGEHVTRAEALVALDNVISKLKSKSKNLPTEKVVYEKAGLYGPKDNIEVIEKDVIIKADGVTLQNVKISGDLIITEEVGQGTVTLNNVTVEGNTFVRGGGTDSIVINQGMYHVINVENVNNKVRIVAKGVKGPDGNPVDIIISENASGNEIIFEGDFNSIDIQADDLVVSTRGTTTINTITVGKNTSGAKLKINQGTNVENLVLDSPANVSGSTNIKNTKNNTKPSTGGGGGGGGGSSSKSNDANLISLELGSGTLSPAFAVSVTEYKVTVGNDVNSITVTPTIANTATAKVNDKIVQSGSSSEAINLNVGNNNVYVTVTAEDSTTTKTYTITIIRRHAITGDNENITVDENTKNIEIADNVKEATITVPENVEGATVNVTTVSNAEGKKEATLPQLTIKSTAADLVIPSGTKITGPADWDGIINLPIVEPNSSTNVDNGEVQAVVEVGLPDVQLTFNKAVRLLIPGQKGKCAGYQRNGVFTEIEQTLSADTQESADAEIPDGGDAKIDAGSNLAIWTKHFTKFVAYQPSVGADSNPPVNAGGYPKAGDTADTMVELLIKTEEAGTAYYVVLPVGADTPSPVQVQTGQDASGSELSGSFKGRVILTANTESKLTITGLAASTSYDIYIVAEDGSHNLQEVPAKLAVNTSNNPPVSPGNSTPADGSKNVDYLSPALSWTCSDPDGHSLTYDIYLGTDRSLVEKMEQSVQKATAYQGTTYLPGQLESVANYYWKVVAKDGYGGETASPLWEFTTKVPEVKTNGIGYFRIENNDSTKCIEGVVTHNRGGLRVPDATVIYPKDIFEHPGDILITKDGYAATRIQNIYWKSVSGSVYGEESVSDLVYGGGGSVSGAVYGWDNLNYVFEVPIRDLFNPAWTNTPPEILIDGINPGDEVSGTIEFDVSFLSGKPFNVCYVYLGGEQRYPNEGIEIDKEHIAVSINTTAYPNGPTYIKILAYDENENAVLYVMPITVKNSVSTSEPCGVIPKLYLESVTYNINVGDYSRSINGVKSLNEEKSNTNPADVSIYNNLGWEPAMGASGYKVYRSFDGVNYKLIGTVKIGAFSDFTYLIGKRTYYKVVPYNSYGDNEEGALTRFVVPLPAQNVYLDGPQNGSTDVNLAPTFNWHVTTCGGDFSESVYGAVYQYFELSIFDATDYQVYYDDEEYTHEDGIDQFNYLLPVELNPGGVYSWDISYADAFTLFENDDTGWSRSLSMAEIGSVNGENLFTTTINVEQEPSNNSVDYLNYKGTKYDAGQVLVKTTDKTALEKSLKLYGSESLKAWENIGWCLVKVPADETVESFIHKLIKDANVIMAQPDYIMEAPKPQVVEDEQQLMTQPEPASDANVGLEVAIDKLWGLQNIHAQEAWQQTTGDKNVILAIIDTGVDTAHPEFGDKTFIAPYDATGEGTPNVDLEGHGTHVAGIAGDNGRNGKIAGIAWDCPIMPVRVENSGEHIFTSYLIEGTNAVTEYVYQYPDYRVVINMSIGGRGYNFAFKDAIDDALEKGVVFVTSAGNDEKRIPSYPTSYNGVIAVAASTPYNTRADFSTTGPWTSVAAPGVKIYSTVPGEGYESWQGTSMASPYVAGASALLLSKYPDLSPIEVKNQLEKTAQGNSFNEELGYGVIDMNAMLGDIKPVDYGSLKVSTNIKESETLTGAGHGVLSVLDKDKNLVAYGLTGENGGHIFHSLYPGDYQVVLSYYNPYQLQYNNQVENVSIQSSQAEEITINFDLPQSVNQTLIDSVDISEDSGEFYYNLTVTEETQYEIKTSFYGEDCDTVLYVFDEDDNEIAYSDDTYYDRYSSVNVNLPAGDYKVYIHEYDYEPLYCNLEIQKLNFTW